MNLDKVKNTFVNKLFYFVVEREQIPQIIITIIFIFLFITKSANLYYEHKTRGDLTNFAQAMWNSSQGRFFQNTFNYSVHNFWGDRDMPIPINSNILGIHFNPILTLFIPMYMVFESPIVLLVVQSLFVASTGFVLYLISRELKLSIFISTVFQLVYLFHRSTLSSVFSEFHAYTLAPLFLTISIYLLLKKRYLWMILFILLGLMVQENIALPVLVWSMISTLTNKGNRKLFLFIFFISITYFILTVYVFIPNISNYHTYIFQGIYGSTLGGNIKLIIINSFNNPSLLINVALSKENLRYMLNQLLPTGIILPIFSPIYMISGLASIGPNLLSSSNSLRNMSMHYEAVSSTLFILATMFGFTKHNHFVRKLLLLLIILGSTISYYKSNYHIISPKFYATNYKQTDIELEQHIKLIDENKSVSTQDYASAQLSNRQELYLFPIKSDVSDYVLISKSEYWPMTKEQQEEYIQKFRIKSNYSIQLETDNFITFKRK